MVMKKNVMRKNLVQSVKKSLGRYIAIAAIIALGAGLFVGLLSTKTDMIETAQKYMDDQNMFDLRLLNSYGWSKNQLQEISELEYVDQAEGMIYMDVIGTLGDSDQENVYQIYSIPEHINKVQLTAGRMPQNANECLLDNFYATEAHLGITFRITDSNSEDTLASLRYQEYTVVGLASTTLFMDMTRGNTVLGDGTIASFLYMMPETFDTDYYTEIAVTLDGDYEVYSDAFTDAMDSAAENLEPQLMPFAQQRYEMLKDDGWEAYWDGRRLYHEGMKEYLDGKRQAQRELEDAEEELISAQEEIEDNEALLLDGEQQLLDGEKQLDEGRKELNDAQAQLDQAKKDANAKISAAEAELISNKQTVEDNLVQVNDGLAQIDEGLVQLDAGIIAMEGLMAPIRAAIRSAQGLVDAANYRVQLAEAALEEARNNPFVTEWTISYLESQLEQRIQERDALVTALEQVKTQIVPYEEQLQELKNQRQEIQQQRDELAAIKVTLEDALLQIEEGFALLEEQKALAESEFASAQAQINSGLSELEEAQKLLEEKRAELEDGKKQLVDAKKQLQEGWDAFYEAEAEVLEELAEAETELNEAWSELEDGRKQLEEMEDPKVYALTRNTNVGYLAVNSNSDIVAGVSKVFPAFFLLVAALVCLTTMTRMVEEERTQIGTLKALGYSNMAIINKYLIYAGSAAVVGCGLGVFLGSIIFPKIIWEGYKIIIKLKPQLDIVFNIPLCLIVLLTYTALTLFVTWFCCRITLRQVPAELIRPKAPASGKKILLEYVPFWKHLRFLDKVMIRNIFRYRQRLLMMLVGICGCTALLVTGFGLGDSVMDIVSYQFEKVTVYDMQVQFEEGLTYEDQQRILGEIGNSVSDMAFAHQSGIDLQFGDNTKSIYMVSAGEDLTKFYDFHSGTTPLTMPADGEVMLSVGVAETMGIGVGDTVLIRNSDMQQMELKVTSLFDNHVYNYAIVTPKTIEQYWGKLPEMQIAYANAPEGVDPHEIGAEFSNMSGVLTVMISQDLADQVGSMLDALNLIVATIIICAGLLAVIVLYNLTNNNITDRMRVIATIKVLGFYAKETALYVFKENLILSIFGAVTGLLGGYWLLSFVMSQIKIDMVTFVVRILPSSLLWSVLITVLMAVLVDVLLYRRLDKINMAEALKSVE